MKKLGYIYKTMNKKNKKVYIGQHVGRFNPSYLGSGLLITRAVKKNGVHSFKVKVLTYAGSKKQLDTLEKRYITEYRKLFPKQLYNIHEGGSGWPCGENHPNKLIRARKRISREKMGSLNPAKRPEVRIKLSIARKRWRFSKAAKLKMSNSKRGKILSSEHRNQIGVGILKSEKYARAVRLGLLRSMGFKGKKHSPETKLKISIARKGKCLGNKNALGGAN